MNVPLKKRYNYCTINNGNIASSLNPNPKVSTTPVYANFVLNNHRDNDVENAVQSNRTKDDENPDKTMAVCTLSTAIVPAPAKGLSNVGQPQQCVQYSSNITNSTQTDSPAKRLCTEKQIVQVRTSSKSSKRQTQNVTQRVSENTSSSSVIITSSASNHSFALSEQNDEQSSSQCSRKLAGENAQKSECANGRHQNKYLTESGIKLIEMLQPVMTTRDRVLNWKIADEFSEIDDDFEDDGFAGPFKSERLQKRHFKRPLKLLDSVTSFKKMAKSTISAMPTAVNAPVLLKKTTLLPTAIDPLTTGSSSSSDAGIDPQRRLPLSKILAKRLISRHPSHLRKRLLLPQKSGALCKTSNQQDTNLEAQSAIKARFDYTKKSLASQTILNNGDDKNGIVSFKVPSVPVANDSQTSQRKVAKVINKSVSASLSSPNHVECSTDHGSRTQEFDDRTSTTSSNEVAEISRANSNREEFYKYLGIDTNPSHDKHSPQSSAGDTTSSSQQRRSLRVKIQQKVVNNLAKSDEKKSVLGKSIDSKTNRIGPNIHPSPTSSNAMKRVRSPRAMSGDNVLHKKNSTTSTAANAVNATIQQSKSVQNNEETESSVSGNCSPVPSMLVRISYIKDTQKNDKKAIEQKNYKSINLVNKRNQETPNNATNNDEAQMLTPPPSVHPNSAPVSSLIFDRKSYEAASNNEATTQPKIAYTAKVLGTPVENEMQKKIESCNKNIDWHSMKSSNCSVTANSTTINADDQSPHVKKETVVNVPISDIRSDIAPSNVPELMEVSNTELKSTLQSKPIKKKMFIRKTITLSEMFKRYKQCIRGGLRSHFHQPHGKRRRRPTRILQRVVNVQCKNETHLSIKPSEISESTSNSNEYDKQDLNSTFENENIIGMPSTSAKHSLLLEDIAFSPTSITHSNASTDSAIVVSNSIDHNQIVPMLVKSHDAMSTPVCHVRYSGSQPHVKNPINSKNGSILALMLNSTQNECQTVIVVQELTVSFWRIAPKLLSVFGVARSWELIGEVKRLHNDEEANSPYQNRVICENAQYPAYVEFRARESPPDGNRQCCLSFVYANVYFMHLDERLVCETIHLDTIKGLAKSITYTAIPKTSHLLMSWTEQTVNRSRCGLCKYNIKMPELDSLENILDFAYLQHDIKSLRPLNDNHVIGCGERTISMWDHRNGSLLLDFEIDIASIGENLGCIMMSYDNCDYMLLIQLFPGDRQSNDGNQQLKIMAVHLTTTYNWRTLHSHPIPSGFGRIQSTLLTNETLTITFANGNACLLNILSPQIIYVRDETSHLKLIEPKIESICNSTQSSDIRESNVGDLNVFVQRDGQIVQISSDFIMTKSVWEYFIEK